MNESSQSSQSESFEVDVNSIKVSPKRIHYCEVRLKLYGFISWESCKMGSDCFAYGRERETRRRWFL